MNLKQDKTSETTEAAHNGVMILQHGDLGCGWGCERVIDLRESTPAMSRYQRGGAATCGVLARRLACCTGKWSSVECWRGDWRVVQELVPQ